MGGNEKPPAGKAKRGGSHDNDGSTFDVGILLNMFLSLAERQQMRPDTVNLEAISVAAAEQLYSTTRELHTGSDSEGQLSHLCFVLWNLIAALNSARRIHAPLTTDRQLLNDGVDILQDMASRSSGENAARSTIEEFAVLVHTMLRYSDERTSPVPTAASMPRDVGGSFPENEEDFMDELLKEPWGEFSTQHVPDQTLGVKSMSTSEQKPISGQGVSASGLLNNSSTGLELERLRQRPPGLPHQAPASDPVSDSQKKLTITTGKPKPRKLSSGLRNYKCGKCGSIKQRHSCPYERDYKSVSRAELKEWSDILKNHSICCKDTGVQQIIKSIEKHLDAVTVSTSTKKSSTNKTITTEEGNPRNAATLQSMESNSSTAASNDAAAVEEVDATDNREAAQADEASAADDDGALSDDKKDEEKVSTLTFLSDLYLHCDFVYICFFHAI